MTATKCDPGSADAWDTTSQKKWKNDSVSRVVPDFDDTRNQVRPGSMVSSTDRTAPGWVESRTKREGLPGPLPITRENTSGARLEPPIPKQDQMAHGLGAGASCKLGQGWVWLGRCQVEPSETVGELGREGLM